MTDCPYALSHDSRADTQTQRQRWPANPTDGIHTPYADLINEPLTASQFPKNYLIKENIDAAPKMACNGIEDKYIGT